MAAVTAADRAQEVAVPQEKAREALEAAQDRHTAAETSQVSKVEVVPTPPPATTTDNNMKRILTTRPMEATSRL